MRLNEKSGNPSAESLIVAEPGLSVTSTGSWVVVKPCFIMMLDGVDTICGLDEAAKTTTSEGAFAGLPAASRS